MKPAAQIVHAVVNALGPLLSQQAIRRLYEVKDSKRDVLLSSLLVRPV